MLEPQVIEKLVAFDENVDGLFVKETQDIPDEFLSALKLERAESLHTPAGEFHRVAAIPTIIVDKWYREGFDIHREPVPAILARLRKEEADAFITSNKV